MGGVFKKNGMKNKSEIRKANHFDQLLDIQYGRIGTKKRDHFEEQAQYFVIAVMLKEARLKAKRGFDQ